MMKSLNHMVNDWKNIVSDLIIENEGILTNFSDFDQYFEGIREGLENPKISWYTSSGNDFRNLIFLNKQYIDKNVEKPNSEPYEEPDLHIFTDVSTWRFENLFPPTTTAWYVKQPKSKMETYLTEMDTLGSWCLWDDSRTRIRLKRFEYLPTLDAEADLQLVDLSEIAVGPKTAAYMLLEVCSKQYGNLGDVHLIYANVENEWFANELVTANAEISHITHVRYGTGFTKNTGSYLKNILAKLKTKYFISDPYLEENRGEAIARLLYPTLEYNPNLKCDLSSFHGVPSSSWSNHGEVSFFHVNKEQ